MNRILCVGDGYAHGHIWPEWPQIIQALIPQHPTVVISGIGAGNEFLISALLDCDPDHDTVIFQWAQPNRFDKIIQDHTWHQLAQQDLIYQNNFYQSGNNTWWLSSASKIEQVQHYHDFYVQSRQQQQRLMDQQRLLQGFLANAGCNLISISTKEQQHFSFETRFNHIRGTEVQPSPPVHMAYLEEKVLPHLAVRVNWDRLARLNQAINQTKWVAYDPDRTELWNQMVKDLDID